MANSNAPQAGQWFYIQSNLTDSSGNNYLVTVQGASAWPGATILLGRLQPNSYNGLPWLYNGLWKCDDDNRIVSAIGNQDLVLDASSYVAPNTWVVLNTANGNSSQQWTFNDDGTITNQSKTGLVLDIQQGVAQSAAWLNVDSAAQGPSASQQWSVVYPQAFAPKWSYIQSVLPVGPNDPPLVATLQEGTSNVVLSPMQPNFSNQLWQITPDGRILSATGGNPVVTLGAQFDGQNGNYIVTAPSIAQIYNKRQWTFTDQNMFINASNGLALSVEGSDANTPLITSAVQSGPPNNQVWLIAPASTLTDIMAAPPVPFPVFTGDQGTVYTYICQQLGVPDLRSEYTNLSVDLNTYLTLLGDMQRPAPPSGVNPADWNANWNSVVAQLENELTAALDIQALFVQYGDFHTKIFADNGARLSALISDARMKQGEKETNVGGIILSVFEGVLYTALEAVPGEGQIAMACAVLGNVMVAAINIGMSTTSRGGGSISPDLFQVAVSDLWDQLSGNFEALLAATSDMENASLTDWGKMEATYHAIFSTGPDSLAWDDQLTSTLITAAIPGYTISVMQMLLPAKYQIYVTNQRIGSSPSNVPQNVQWGPTTGDNAGYYYWIATPGNWSEYPSNEAMEDVWNSGVAQADFFLGLAGWGFPTSYTTPLGGCNYLVITITNQTPNPLTVTAFPNNNQGIVVSTDSTLQPYGSLCVKCEYGDGLAIDIVISDPNLATDSVASFTAHQHHCSTAAGDVWVDTISTSVGYQLTTPICNPGSYEHHYSGAVQVGICLASINPPPSS